jgi:hypothetical protein
MHRVTKTAAESLGQGAVQADRSFWRGERPISLLQRVGLILMLVTAVIAVLGCRQRKLAPSVASPACTEEAQDEGYGRFAVPYSLSLRLTLFSARL